MSDPPTRRASDIAPRGIPWGQVGAAVGVIIVVLTFLGTLGAWLTGGLHPQWQNDIAELRASNASLRADLNTATTKLDAAQQTAAATANSQRDALSALIAADKQLFTTRLDAMWRPEDYTARDTHLSRLDTVFEALRDRVTKLEYDDQRLTEKFQQLTTVPAARSK